MLHNGRKRQRQSEVFCCVAPDDVRTAPTCVASPSTTCTSPSRGVQSQRQTGPADHACTQVSIPSVASLSSRTAGPPPATRTFAQRQRRRRRGSSIGRGATCLALFLGGAETVRAWSSRSNSSSIVHTKKGLLEVTASCTQQDFLVNHVYLLCDSPGAYYRGSAAYRDSTTCSYGDKARVEVDFVINDSFTGASSLRLEIEAGIYDQWKRVSIMDDLCSYSGSRLQHYTDGGVYSSCPYPGRYQLDTYFYIPAIGADSELHYTPDLRFRFYNAKGNVLGCATTGTVAIRQHAQARAQAGMVALSMGLITLACIFGLLIYLNYGREKRQHKLQTRQRRTAMEEESEVERRYQYFNNADKNLESTGSSRTTQTGSCDDSSAGPQPTRQHPTAAPNHV